MVPAAGINQPVVDWGCNGGDLPNLVVRWDCPAADNTFLMAHDWTPAGTPGVFHPLTLAYDARRLKVGSTATTTIDGVTHTWRVTWIRVASGDYTWQGKAGKLWAWNDSAVPVLTLATCYRPNDQQRLVVRFELVS